MCAILKEFLKKHKSILAYLIIGGLTTIVNWCAYFPLRYITDFPAAISSGIAWLVAVLFAFPTNKMFVYESKQWSIKNTTAEFLGFVSCRLLSGLLEAGILYVVDDVLHMNGVLWKILASVIVVVLNYLSGKLLVFRRK